MVTKLDSDMAEKRKEPLLTKHNLARIFTRIFYPLLNLAFRPLTKKHLTVFLFHEVTDSPSKFQKQALNYTSTRNFYNCIDWILKNYEILSINQLTTERKSRRKPLAVLTFDDAWRGQFSAIKKVTTGRKLPIAYFINMGTVQSRIDVAALKTFYAESTPNFYELISKGNQFRTIDNTFLDWQGELIQDHEVQELLGNSLVTIGNHGYHHYSSAELTTKEFVQNVELNEQKIYTLKTNSKYFAFPFGRPFLDFTIEQVSILDKRGYKLVFAADSKLNKVSQKDAMYISRVHFAPSDKRSSDFWWATNKSIFMKKA